MRGSALLFFERVRFIYRRLFSIHEIETSFTLQLLTGASLFILFRNFSGFIREGSITVEAFLNNNYLCWPYFLDCGELYFLHMLPNGYSQTALYSGFLFLMALIAYAIAKGKWTIAHLGILILWSWQTFAIFALSMELSSSYMYYATVLIAVFLFLPHKLFFSQFIFVFLYFLAATVKFHEGWILGSIFTSYETGLPFVSDAYAPVAANILIIFQVFGSWFLLSQRMILQRVAFAFSLLFHVYSGILILYGFPILSILYLLILFGPLYKKIEAPFDFRSIPGWALSLTLLILQLFPILAIAGDHRITQEGNRFGLFMFEANYQCVAERDVVFAENESERTVHFGSGRGDCDPYAHWFRTRNLCSRSDEGVESVAFSLDVSIDGGPFYRIVDEENLCAVRYHSFTHNDWIQTPEGGARVVGYPVENKLFYYRNPLLPHVTF